MPRYLKQLITRSQLISRLLLSIFCTLLILPYMLPGYSYAKSALPPVYLEESIIECFNAKNWECAVQELTPLYYEQGQDSNLHYYIAYSYRELSRIELAENELSEAAEHLELALEFVDSDATLFADLGNVYFQLSSYDQAKDAYLQASELDASNQYYFVILGQISYLTGDLTNATSNWEKALELKPDCPTLRQRLQQLQKQEVAEGQGTTEVSHVFRITFDKGMDRQIYNEVWEMLEDAWYDLGIELALYPRRQIPVLLLSNKKFTSMTDAPSWAGGVYEGQIKIPVADFDRERLQEVIAHEYLHALIYDTMANRCPWWLNEGLAQYFSLDDQARADRLKFAGDTQQKNSSVTLAHLPGNITHSEQAKAAYALALSGTDFLIQRFSLITLRAILFNMGEGMSFAESFQHNTGYSVNEFSSLWTAGR